LEAEEAEPGEGDDDDVPVDVGRPARKGRGQGRGGRRQESGASGESVDAEELAKPATTEELHAEMRHQAGVLSSLLGDDSSAPRRGRGRGGAASGRGRGAGATGSSGLLVGRYNPLAPTSASSAPLKRYNADERDDDDNDDGDESERETVPQPEPEKVVTAFNRKDKLVTVRSEFASLFRKADGSREAPLAQEVDEGKPGGDEATQEAPIPEPDVALSVPAPVGGLDWLGSIVGGTGTAEAPKEAAVVSMAVSPEAPAYAKWVGKALPIPPFYRHKPLWQLEKDVSWASQTKLPRLFRLAHDARRAEQKRGGLRKHKKVDVFDA